MKLALVEGCRDHVRRFADHAGQLEADFMPDRCGDGTCFSRLVATLLRCVPQ